MCNNAPESIEHALRDCISARKLWNSRPLPMHANSFYGTGLIGWLKTNCYNKATMQGTCFDWSNVFSFGIWSLWIQRNRKLFNQVNPIQDLKLEILAKTAKFYYLGSSEKNHSTHVNIQVKWVRPLLNWFKLKSDGSSMGNPGLARGGGLIRDANGS